MEYRLYGAIWNRGYMGLYGIEAIWGYILWDVHTCSYLQMDLSDSNYLISPTSTFSSENYEQYPDPSTHYPILRH